MRLVELVITREKVVIRHVRFKEGLNLILDKPTPAKTKSGNSVGKTTLLRLIDFCLGSDGEDIWQDSEFKTSINQDVYDFLHGTIPVTITLRIEDAIRGNHTLTRTFASVDNRKPSFLIDSRRFKQLKSFRTEVKELLFGYGGDKPSLRQLMPKFVRSSVGLMSKTLKYLGEYASETDYEALHLFLFGFFAVQVLEERPRLTTAKKRLDRDLAALNRLRKEGEIEQLLFHLRREIESIGLSPQLKGEVPEIAAHADVVTGIRSRAANIAGNLSRFDSEIASLSATIEELESEFSDIDRQSIESIYRDAQLYIPKLHHDWNDLADFVQNLRGRKQRFLRSQIDALRLKASNTREELKGMQALERAEIGSLVTSPEFAKAMQMRTDLQEKLKTLGSLEQDLEDLRELKLQIADVEKGLEATQETIEQEKASLAERVSIFNKYFSTLSQLLYGEQYLLHFDETSKGSISFQLSAVGSNVGAGKKASQTAAFDLAYIEFLRETGINFPRFICHDGVESIHGNQLAALLNEAARLDGQLVLATLRDKLPAMPDGFIEENTVLELGHDDKLFRLDPHKPVTGEPATTQQRLFGNG